MDISELEVRLRGVLEHFKSELSGIRANRPNPKMIEDVLVEYFGQMMPLKQLGTINVVPPRELHISVWDHNALAPAAKAVEAANLGLSVAVSGNMIRVVLPTLSAERRSELVKIAKQVSEAARISVRGSRDEANKKIDAAEKSKAISEDIKFSLKKKVQEAVDKTNKEIESLLGVKIKEIEE